MGIASEIEATEVTLLVFFDFFEVLSPVGPSLFHSSHFFVKLCALVVEELVSSEYLIGRVLKSFSVLIICNARESCLVWYTFFCLRDTFVAKITRLAINRTFSTKIVKLFIRSMGI